MSQTFLRSSLIAALILLELFLSKMEAPIVKDGGSNH